MPSRKVMHYEFCIMHYKVCGLRFRTLRGDGREGRSGKLNPEAVQRYSER